MRGGEGDDEVGPGPADVRSVARYQWWLVRSQGGRAAVGAVLGTTWMVGLAAAPYLLSRAIDAGLRVGGVAAVLPWAGLVLAAGVAQAVVGMLRHRTMSRMRMHGTLCTVHAVAVRATELGGALTRKLSTGEVVAIGTGDVTAIGTALSVVGLGVGAIVAYAVVAGLLLAIAPLPAAVVLVGAPLLVVLVGPVLQRLVPVGVGYRERQGALTARTVDIAEGLSVLDGIGGRDHLAATYRRDSTRLLTEGLRVARVSSWVPALGTGLPAVFLGAVTWLAARMAADGAISVGDLVAVYGYVAVLVVPVAELIWSAEAVGKSVVATRRVLGLLQLTPDEPPSLPDVGERSPVGDLCDPGSGVVVAPGVLAALVAEPAADATAVLERLGCVRPAAVPVATWGGVPLTAVPVPELRRRIVVLDADAHLFTGSVRDVVGGRRAPDAEVDAEIARALHAAAADDVVRGLPAGLAAAVAPQGRNLSGGQRQRLRLARALLAEPEVLLAPDPTSALDAHTEALVAERLRAARTGRTTVLATTSPLLLDRVDVVTYLVDGRVRAVGPHHVLLRTEPGYRHLVTRAADPMGKAPEPTR